MRSLEKLQEIDRLLREAYEHYFANSDGHCKSSEGYVSVGFGNYWDRLERGLVVTSVEVYSYVLGPHRSHYFGSLDEALSTVRCWHKAEMEHDYESDNWDEAQYEQAHDFAECQPDLKW